MANASTVALALQLADAGETATLLAQVHLPNTP
jgi:hypothetical protein